MYKSLQLTITKDSLDEICIMYVMYMYIYSNQWNTTEDGFWMDIPALNHTAKWQKPCEDATTPYCENNHLSFHAYIKRRNAPSCIQNMLKWRKMGVLLSYVSHIILYRILVIVSDLIGN